MEWTTGVESGLRKNEYLRTIEFWVIERTVSATLKINVFTGKTNVFFTKLKSVKRRDALMIKIFWAVVLNSDMPFKFGRFRICFYLVQCLVMHCLPACSSMLYASSLINLFSDLSPKAGFFQSSGKVY